MTSGRDRRWQLNLDGVKPIPLRTARDGHPGRWFMRLLKTLLLASPLMFALMFEMRDAAVVCAFKKKLQFFSSLDPSSD